MEIELDLDGIRDISAYESVRPGGSMVEMYIYGAGTDRITLYIPDYVATNIYDLLEPNVKKWREESDH